MPQLVGKQVGSIGYGLMGLTWRPDPPSQEQAFHAMRCALSQGANFWNGGELYGSAERNSLHLLNEYFTKRPGDAEKVVLSIKGGLAPGEMRPDGSEKNVRRSIDECLRVLDGKKSLDLFECARVDPNTPIEVSIRTMAEYVKEGKLGGISLSEVGADTIRRAAKVHKISAVEVEFSITSPDILHNGIASTCAELEIPIAAYSPLGRGLLTATFKSVDEIPEGNFLRHMPRYQKDTFEHNVKFAEAIGKVADKKGCSKAQLALAWVKAHSGKDGCPIIIPIPGATTEERIMDNMKDVTLSEEEMAEINEIIKAHPIKGERYGGPQAALMNG